MCWGVARIISHASSLQRAASSIKKSDQEQVKMRAGFFNRSGIAKERRWVRVTTSKLRPNLFMSRSA